jgi:hypothetical protein
MTKLKSIKIQTDFSETKNLKMQVFITNIADE